MSTVLAIIALIIVLAIVIILVLAMRKPDTFRLERSTTIKAPPEKIFPLVNDFHQLDDVVALGETRPGAEAQLWRRRKRQGCDL